MAPHIEIVERMISKKRRQEEEKEREQQRKEKKQLKHQEAIENRIPVIKGLQDELKEELEKLFPNVPVDASGIPTIDLENAIKSLGEKYKTIQFFDYADPNPSVPLRKFLFMMFNSGNLPESCTNLELLEVIPNDQIGSNVSYCEEKYIERFLNNKEEWESGGSGLKFLYYRKDGNQEYNIPVFIEIANTSKLAVIRQNFIEVCGDYIYEVHADDIRDL